MSSQTSTFPLLLANQSKSNEASEPLSSLIRRIIADRGHLRNVTEDSLKDEIRKQHEASEDIQDASQDSNPTLKDLEARQKELSEARASMLQNVSDAHNQALLLLDSVSFLLKDRVPRAADSMSPALKEMFQQGGGLSYSMLPPPKPTETDIEQDNLTTMGLTLNSLDRNADSLLDAATKLQSEVKKETQYWDDVLSVCDNGWSICRVRGQKNTLGVRYGFPEASQAFTSRSMAVMRADEDGHIVLDSGVTRDPKTVRVRIVEGQTLLADCRQTAKAPDSEDVSTRILRARDSLFEEELFYELEQEARSLLNYGVRVDGHEIHLPLSLEALQDHPGSSNSRHMILSLESLQTEFHGSNRDPAASRHAHALALSLRLLLTNVYRKRFRERSRPPPLISLQKKSAKTSEMLRFLMTFIQHQHASTHIARIIEFAGKVVRLAKLEASTTHEDEELAQSSDTAPPMEHLIDTLAGPWKTTHALKLSQDAEVSVTVMTALQAPTYGTRYIVKTSFSSGSPAEAKYSLGSDTIHHVNRSIRAALFDHLCAISTGWDLMQERSPISSEMQRSEGKVNGVVIGLAASGVRLAIWFQERGVDDPRIHAWELGRQPKMSFDEMVKIADS